MYRPRNRSLPVFDDVSVFEILFNQRMGRKAQARKLQKRQRLLRSYLVFYGKFTRPLFPFAYKAKPLPRNDDGR